VKTESKNAANCCKTPLFDLENVLIIGLKCVYLDGFIASLYGVKALKA